MVRSFLKRRIRNSGLLMVALALIWLWVRARERNLQPAAHATGYIMIAVVFFLALYNIRKKVSFLPLGTSSTWLQWHVYVGLGSIGVFTLHTGLYWPTGVVETSLFLLYTFTTLSGLLGLYWTRAIPGQLARVGEEVMFERIPSLRRRMQWQANETVIESVSASGATMLANFYTTRMYDFFQLPRGLNYFLRPNTTHRKSLMADMQHLQRYLSEPERKACEKLFALVRQKDDLDFHWARQGLLKYWLFVHIGLTYALVIAASLHGLMATAFGGGL